MATITHGGTLPDSSQKTDFYGLIDNATISSITSADMSAGANIPDSMLQTISTASKVNVSALTGTIANANLAQLTTAGLVSGAALTLLPNTPSGAGILPVANVGGLLGSWTSKTIGQIYQAATDGIILAWIIYSSGSTLKGYTDSSATPTTLRIQADSTSTSSIAIFFPVRKSDYYEVTGANTSNAMWFISLAS